MTVSDREFNEWKVTAKWLALAMLIIGMMFGAGGMWVAELFF